MLTTVFTSRSAWPLLSLWPGVVNTFLMLYKRANSFSTSLV